METKQDPKDLVLSIQEKEDRLGKLEIIRISLAQGQEV
jgi:hypothetical protein